MQRRKHEQHGAWGWRIRKHGAVILEFIFAGFIVSVWVAAFIAVIWGSFEIYSGEWEPPIPHPKITWTVLLVAFSTLTFAALVWGLSSENNADHCGPGTEYRKSTQYNPSTKLTTSTWWCEAK